jgi:hypothetical protein
MDKAPIAAKSLKFRQDRRALRNDAAPPPSPVATQAWLACPR